CRGCARRASPPGRSSATRLRRASSLLARDAAFFLARDFAILARDDRGMKLCDGLFRKNSHRHPGRERLHVDRGGFLEQLHKREGLVEIDADTQRAVVLKYVAVASIGELA